MQVYTRNALSFIHKANQVSHTITNITASTRSWIIALGIRKQPSYRQYHHSRAGKTLFNKINTIVTTHSITFDKCFAQLRNLVTIQLLQSVRTTPADLLSFVFITVTQ